MTPRTPERTTGTPSEDRVGKGGGGRGVWLKPGLFGSWMCVCWQDSTRQLPNRPHMVFQCLDPGN